MPLSAGTRLGVYEILAPLGAGGMGEVYRAKDSKLDREVAIKVLPQAVAQDPERLARFEREAKVLAALNHPNIAAIYGVQERALVMELVEGDDLGGPLPLETALNYARQIAEALEAAHEKGIVHRDLKPANVKVTPQGVVKVLDFGLAAVVQGPASENSANSPTLTMRATQAGMIMGTAGYMSPEQASGKPVDKRADIWSFGVVLCEMLTGRRLFGGETVPHTLADVLKGDIDFSKLPPDTPAAIRELLRRCLDRDVKNRLRDIGEARVLIDNAGKAPGSPATTRTSRVWPWIIGATALALALATTLVMLWPRTVEHPLMRLSVDLGPDALAGDTISASLTAAISPDGTRLVFSSRGADGKRVLATRLLDQTKLTPLAGTENGGDPFFSPDGQWVGFFTDRKLKKISVQGGAPITLSDVANPKGASWGEDGNIIVALTNTGGLWRVPAAGGTPQRLTQLRPGEATHRWPQVLPGGKSVLFMTSNSISTYEDASIETVSLTNGARKTVLHGGYFGRYLSSGHLVYVHEGVLFGISFDSARLEVKSAPTPLLEDIASDPNTAAGQFDVSGTGTFVYFSGKAAPQTWSVTWMDSSGNTQPLLSKPGVYLFPRLSPDGQRLALSMEAGKGLDLWIDDWPRDTMSRLTFGAQENLSPVWTPDGKHIAFESAVPGGYLLSWIRSDGAGGVQRLMEGKNEAKPFSFAADGRRLAYVEADPESHLDLWTLPLDLSDPDHPKPGKPEPFLHTPSNEQRPAFSPDGRWIAYDSDESGADEVYVRPFPSGPAGGKWQISTSGGHLPIWSRNGRELFYETPDNRIMSTEWAAKGDSFAAAKPRLWSNKQIFAPTDDPNLDLAADGKRFATYARSEAETKGSVHVTFLLNFFDELRRRLPADRK